MADHRDIDDAMDYLREVYGRSDSWPGRMLRGEWETTFTDVPGPAMMVAVKAAMKESPKFPPTPMVVATLVEGRAGGAVTGTLGPGPCPDCRTLFGYREMAIHWIDPRGDRRALVVLSACECRLGDVRRTAGAEAWRDTWKRWQDGRDRLVRDGGQVVGIYRTHRDHLTLDDAERYTPEALSRWPAKPRSEAVRGVLAALHAHDEHARERGWTMRMEQQNEMREDVW